MKEPNAEFDDSNKNIQTKLEISVDELKKQSSINDNSKNNITYIPDQSLDYLINDRQ